MPIIFSSLNYNCYIALGLRNLQQQVKRHSVSNIVLNCSRHLKIFVNSGPSTSNFKSFSQTLKQLFLTVGQNNYGNKIPITYNQTNSRVTFWFSNLSKICTTKLESISWVWIDADIRIRLHKRFIVFIPQILCVASFQGTFPAWKSYIMQQNFIILYFFQFNFSLSFLYGFFLALSFVSILLNCYIIFIFLTARDAVLGSTLMVV